MEWRSGPNNCNAPPLSTLDTFSGRPLLMRSIMTPRAVAGVAHLKCVDLKKSRLNAI